MGEPDTTVRSRELGARSRRVMEAAGLTGQQTARLLGWSQSEVSRLLNGKLTVKEADIAAFAGICRVDRAERESLLKLCKDANTPGWWQTLSLMRPDQQLRTLIDHEQNAVAITEFDAMLVPGLLQTSSYMRAMMQVNGGPLASPVEERVTTRLARQQLLGSKPGARYTYYVHESVLATAVGGQSVMSEQLHHLLRMSVRPYISLRLVPASIGAHPAMAGSFSLMRFAEINPVVYLESEISTQFLEEPDEIEAYRHIESALADVALPERQSAALIAKLAVETYGGGKMITDTAKPTGIVWQTSSYSAAQGDCVEVASTPAAVLVRDTKNRAGGVLSFTSEQWRTFRTGFRPRA